MHHSKFSNLVVFALLSLLSLKSESMAAIQECFNMDASLLTQEQINHAKERDQKRDTLEPDTYAFAPFWGWINIQLPFESVKVSAFTEHVRVFSSGRVNTNELKNIFEGLISSPVKLPGTKESEAIRSYVQAMKKSRHQGGTTNTPGNYLVKYFQNSDAARALMCAKYTLSGQSLCKAGLKSMLYDNQPVWTYGLFLEDIIEEVLLDASYSVPVNKLALKMLQNYRDPKEPVVGNWFEDLKHNFIKQGETEEAAIGKSLKVFAFLSLQGPELFHIVRIHIQNLFGVNIEQESAGLRVLLGLKTISTLGAVLDLRQVQQDLPLYTLPQHVQSTCLNGKYYHFWMSAYWSWQIAQQKKGDDKTGAEFAPWIVGSLYQMLSDSYGRGMFKSLEEDYDSDYNKKVRRDLTHVYSAALYGKDLAQKQASKKVSIDALYTLLKTTGKKPSIAQAAKNKAQVEELKEMMSKPSSDKAKLIKLFYVLADEWKEFFPDLMR